MCWAASKEMCIRDRPKTILFNLSGNGVIDLYAYEQYLAGALKDYAPGDAEIAKTVSRLEQLI